MKNENLPTVEARYWSAMFIASLVGTTTGDYVSTTLGLGFVRGLPLLGLMLAAIFVAERRGKHSSEIYYWAAIVATRTMATNIADLATHALRLDYTLIEAALFAALLSAMFLRGGEANASNGLVAPATRSEDALPKNDARYWTTLLIASVIGTTLGDFTSDELGLGVAHASIILAPILLIGLHLRSKSLRRCLPTGASSSSYARRERWSPTLFPEMKDLTWGSPSARRL